MYNNPYYNPTPRYQSNNNQMAQPNYMQPIPPIQSMPTMNNQMGLLGKVVDSIDVVKSMDIPLDGSVSYFALADGSAIVTKQLQNDGTSKMVVYKPVEQNEKELPRYATIEDVKKEINKIDLSEFDDIKEELKDIRKQLKEFKIKKSKESKEE